MKGKTKSVKALLLGMLAFVLTLSFAITAGLHSSAKTLQAYSTASGSTIEENAIEIEGDLWNASANTFNSQNLLAFFNALSPMISGGVSTPVTAQDIRDNNSSKDIVVTLGGLKWVVTYISEDKSGNTIATLWLTDYTQLYGKSYYSYDGLSEFDKYGTIFSRFQYKSVYSDTYPASMYGSSFMRSVILNNGGGYASGRNAFTSDVEQHSDHEFAMFTMPSSQGGSDLYDYIVTPSDISWQETGEWSSPNGYWGYVDSDSNYNYYNKNTDTDTAPNSAWKNDKLWLPSEGETGDGRGNLGRWELSNAQMMDGKPGYYWLRSGYTYNDTDSKAMRIISSGELAFTAVGGMASIRPAFHFNLSAAEEVLSVKTEVGGVKYSCMGNNATVTGYTANVGANVVIPASIEVDNATYAVTGIASEAFKNCAALESVTLESSSPIEIGTDAFDGCENLATILVPKTSLGAYNNALSQYNNLLQAAPETGVFADIVLPSTAALAIVLALAYVLKNKRKEQF